MKSSDYHATFNVNICRAQSHSRAAFTDLEWPHRDTKTTQGLTSNSYPQLVHFLQVLVQPVDVPGVAESDRAIQAGRETVEVESKRIDCLHFWCIGSLAIK